MNRTSLLIATALVLSAGAALAQAPATPAAPDTTVTQTPAPETATPAPAPTTQPSSLPTSNATAPSAVADLGPNSPMPSRPHHVHTRTDAQIRAERDQMTSVAAAADGEALEAKKGQVEVKGRIEVKKKEIETLNARAKLAKQSKAEADRAALESARKTQDRVKSYFEREADVAAAAIDEAEARRDWARAAIRVCDLELQMVGRAGNPANDADPALFKLEQQYLDAVKTRGAAEEKFANKLQTLADRKLKVYSGWADYLGGK